MTIDIKNVNGIGMTSQRTRNRLIDRLRQKGIKNDRVLEVMRNTPRHLFMDEALSSRAYEDTALPIGHGQTISQPFIVARMTELLLEGKNVKSVLEVGTGSGYQTAVLAQLVEKIYSVERLRVLSNQAKVRLHQLQYHNVTLTHTDGHWGWERHAPYDAILVTAAPETVPQELLLQLKQDGRLVIPVGGSDGQRLHVITRQQNEFHQETLDAVSFVPLLSGEK
ncbi:MAG: protein-L-isoaspartate(D-aspartate) O-methyltransferase [Gammaproteobacteria bacterium]